MRTRSAVRFGRPAPAGAAMRARFAAARLLWHLRAFTPRFRKPDRNGLLRIGDLLAAAAALQLPALHLVHLFAYFFAGPRTVFPASRRPMRGRTFSGCHRTFSLHRIGKHRGMRGLRATRAELPAEVVSKDARAASEPSPPPAEYPRHPPTASDNRPCSTRRSTYSPRRRRTPSVTHPVTNTPANRPR